MVNKPDCLSIWIVISPPEALLLGIFLITFSTSLTKTSWKESFSSIKYLFLFLTILGWFLNFLMILASVFLVKPSLFEDNSKVFYRFCKMFIKGLSNFIVIYYQSFFFNNLICIWGNFFFSVRIILESPWACLLEK